MKQRSLGELKILSDRLARLLADPHPGLITWCDAIHRTIKAIHDWSEGSE